MISLPIIYMAFGVCSEGDYVILKEVLYGLPWIIAGILVLAYDFKYSAYVVGILWVVHGGYDLISITTIYLSTLGVWSWYPVLCKAFDIPLDFIYFTLHRNGPNQTYEWPSKMHNQAMVQKTKRFVLINLLFQHLFTV